MKEYSEWEFLIYNVLRSASLIFLAYPFMRDSGRFSRKVTVHLFVLMEVLWVAIAQIGQFPFFRTMGFAVKIELVQTVMLVGILILALKERPGKVLFVFFVLYSLGSLQNSSRSSGIARWRGTATAGRRP